MYKMKKSTIGLSGVAAAVLMALSLNVGALEASSVSASANDGNVAANTVDDNLSTRWSAKGNDGSNWLEFNFDSAANISAVNIAFYKGDSRSTYFEIQSSEDGSDWSVELSGTSSGASNELETFELNNSISAQYVRIVGLGNSSNTWNSITEVTFTEAEVETPVIEEPETEEPVDTTPIDASATSSANDGNVAANVLDDSLDTRWSANGSGQWLRLDLGSQQSLDNVQIAFFKGNARQSNFSIELSNDGSTWSTAVSETNSSGNSVELETFTFNETTARYVRYTGYGNSANTWNSVTEFAVVATGTVVTEPEEETPIVVIPDTGLPMHALNPSLPPSSNFDLSQWNLSVPIDNGEGDGYAKATTIKVADLEGYESLDTDNKDYFWTNTTDGGMVFRDYVGGARTSKGTSYSRTELREMLRGTDTSIKTQGVNENNWVFGNAPDDQLKDAGGVGGNMVATLSVNAVTSTGDSSQKGRVIVGQIHAASDEPLRLYYRLLPGHTKGSIYFAHEPSNGNDEQWYEMIGSRSSSADEPEDGVELNEKFSYEIDVVDSMMYVSIMRDGKDTITQPVDMKNSGYDGFYEKDGETLEDYMYFKAGVYNQNNSGEESDYVQATFYYLTHTH